ncbi:MAG: acylphosphatase [Anaerolinea sp.]|nr:acylphosphatase [Anaerolinea sp.]
MDDQHETERTRLEAIVYGRVQGVSFRYYTQVEAQRLGINGWVANRHDGAVQVVGEGSETALRQLAEFLHRGSPLSRVDHVALTWSDASGEFRYFRVRHL